MRPQSIGERAISRFFKKNERERERTSIRRHCARKVESTIYVHRGEGITKINVAEYVAHCI